MSSRFHERKEVRGSILIYELYFNPGLWKWCNTDSHTFKKRCSVTQSYD